MGLDKLFLSLVGKDLAASYQFWLPQRHNFLLLSTRSQPVPFYSAVTHRDFCAFAMGYSDPIVFAYAALRNMFTRRTISRITVNHRQIAINSGSPRDTISSSLVPGASPFLSTVQSLIVTSAPLPWVIPTPSFSHMQHYVICSRGEQSVASP